MKLYSYVVEHDTGYAPNPYFGLCTLCRCKYRKRPGNPSNIVELAKGGDWIVGTGGANKKKSAGNGKLVYAMKVDEKLTRLTYWNGRRFSKKKVAQKIAAKDCAASPSTSTPSLRRLLTVIQRRPRHPCVG